MATRQQKKKRLKEINNRIKETKRKKKDEKSDINSNEKELKQIISISNDRKSYTKRKSFVGIREFALSELSEIIEDLKNDVISDSNIKDSAGLLYHLAMDPIKSFLEYLEFLRESVGSKAAKVQYDSMKKSSSMLNRTERAVLKTQMMSILSEYFMVGGVYDKHDYGAIRVAFETARELIYEGLQEKKISSLILNVGYGDTLESIEVEYEDSDKKYILQEHIIIFPIWNSLDEFYRKHSIYKVEYSNFSEESINSLATAENMFNNLRERNEGSEMISYKGIAMNFLGVLEEEVKNMVCKKLRLNLTKLTFNDAINHLRKGQFGELSEPDMIERLDKLRILRNKAAHPGNTITVEDIEYIENELISRQVLKFIDWKLTDIKMNA